MLIVMKFGGTSVGDASRIGHAADLAIESAAQGHQVVVVTSARLTREDHAMFARSAFSVISKDSLTRELVTGAIRQATGSTVPGGIDG